MQEFSPDEERSTRAPRLRALNGGGDAKPLPYSLDAEASLLSCCLMDGVGMVARCEAARLHPRAFYDPKHAVVFERMLDMRRKNLPMEIAVLAEELKSFGQLDYVGGFPFLAQVTDRIPTTAQATYFIDKVSSLALLRSAIRDFGAAVEESYAVTGDVASHLGRIALKAQRLADFALRSRRASQLELAKAARASAVEVAEGRVDKSRWLHLGGLPHADAAFLPFDTRNEDWLNLIAGPPSGGKSTLLRQHLGHQLLAGKRVVVFLLETSTRRWLQSLAAMFAGVNVRELDRELPEKVKLFDDWMATIETWMDTQLWVFDDIFVLEDIERQVRELNRQLRDKEIAAGVPEDKALGLHAVGGDYLQLLNSDAKFKQREEQVAFFSRTLKRLHKGIDVPGFWCVQLNRGPRSDGRRPKLTDLRESGALEQDADCVLMLHTPEENKAGQRQDGSHAVDEVELIQAKRRNGPRDVYVEMLFHKRWGRYEDVIKRGEVRPGMPKPKDGYKREGGAPHV